jgi:hypothetical protein
MTRSRYKRVLAELNRYRDRMGLTQITEIPSGAQWKPECCPVALACGGPLMHAEAYGKAVYVVGNDENVYRFELSTVLQNFVRDFDDGQFPELVRQ